MVVVNKSNISYSNHKIGFLVVISPPLLAELVGSEEINPHFED